MYVDPQSLTINAVAVNLPRILSTATNGTFSSADGNIVVRVSQNATAGRFRREVRVTQRKIAIDPISATNKEVTASFIMVFDEPKIGFSDTELGYLSTALMAWFTAARRDQLLGGEA